MQVISILDIYILHKSRTVHLLTGIATKVL